MANVILKSIKFTKILNGRLSFSSMKPYFINGRYSIRSYNETRQTKAYATAAYKLETNDDLVMKNNVASSKVTTKDINSIDNALSKIDSLIRRTGRTQMKNVYEALSLIASKEMISSTHGLYLIRSCKYCSDEPPSKRIELVNQVWNKCQEFGVEFDVRHYNSLLDVHITNGFNFNPGEILASMEDVNVQPNKDTYLLIMKKYCQDGNIEGASEILEYMKKEGLSADENVFNYLIEGHIKNNDFKGAKDMVEVMRSSNLQPNADTYCALACGYAAIGEKNEMMSYLNECSDISSINHYLKVITVLATSGNQEHIDEVFSLIQHKENYREEFLNAAVDLIHKDQLDVAYKMACAACSPTNNESTNIFIKQLIRLEKPTSKVLQYCQSILEEDLNKNIYLIASNIAAKSGLLDLSVSLFKQMIEQGFFLRPSAFWPLFAYSEQQKSSKDIWAILKKMVELGVPADFSTYCEVIYPMLGVPKPEDIIHNVKLSGQTVEMAANSLFVYYCNLGELDYAIELVQMCPVTVGTRFKVERFLSNLVNFDKESLNKCLKVLKFILSEVNTSHNAEIQGKLLAGLIVKKVNILEALLKKYEDLSFSPKVLNLCERKVFEMNPSRQGFVRKLKAMFIERGSIFTKENLSVEEEKKCISYLQAQNIPCGPFLAKRVNYHIKKRNVARVSELLPLFKELNLTYSPLILANLISLYCVAGDIGKAMETADKLKTEFPGFKLDLIKSLEYATYLARYEKLDESFDVLSQVLKEPYSYTNKDFVFRVVKRLLGCLNEVNNAEFVEKMQNLLFPLSEEIGSKAMFLEPLIRFHLQRGDVTSAFDEFKNVVMKYRIPAGLNALLKKCITLDDKITLQKVIDLATGCSRKTFVLLELAVAFIETRNIQKAMKLIENLGREIHPKDLEDICIKLCQLNKITELEQLIQITRPLSHVNREDLYMHAFRAYAFNNDLGRAEKLFAILKKEIPEPKPETINYVQNLLKKSVSSNQHHHETLVSQDFPENVQAEVLEATKTFIEQLKAGNAEAALNELSALKKGYIRTLSLKSMSDLIDLCLERNCTDDLSSNVHAMSYIIENSKVLLNPILEKYSAVGDVEKFVTISQFFPDFSLMSVGFNAYLCKAYINSGKHDELLAQLEANVDKRNKLFSQLAFEELLKFPQYEDRISNLAVKYLESSYHTPIGVLWSHYFLKEDFEKAHDIFKKYFVQVDKVDTVLKHIREKENEKLALKYVDFVKDLAVRLRTKQRAYGTALELLVAKGMYDEAVSLVVESEELNLHLHKYYLTPLTTLKNVLEKENKAVPFSIPSDLASDSRSVSE